MPDLLGRELTAPEQAVKAALEKAFSARGKTRDLETELRTLAARAPEAFFAAALCLLGSAPDVSACRRLYRPVADLPGFWIELLRAGRFSRAELLEVCRYLMTIETWSTCAWRAWCLAATPMIRHWIRKPCCAFSTCWTACRRGLA